MVAPNLPDFLIPKDSSNTSINGSVNTKVHAHMLVNGNINAYAEAALDDECSAVAMAVKGARNESLNRASFALAQLVASGELSENIVRSRLYQAAKACGLSDIEITRTLDSGFKAGIQNPRAQSNSMSSNHRYEIKLPPSETIILPEFSAAQFADKVVPDRKFHDAKGHIPCEGVTLLFGDGGTGKSLLALQLAVATVTGKQWLGMNVRQGPVYYYSAEDTSNEVHIRLHSITQFLELDFARLEGFKIAPMAGCECVLAANNGKGIIVPTPCFTAFTERVRAIRPALVIIDNLIDVFAGNLIDPPQAKQFMHLLSGVSLECKCPILILAHPSASGMASGAGDGGTKAWSNSARSRLYLQRIFSQGDGGLPIEDNPNARLLTRKKANYGPTGDEVKMYWEEGVFIHDQVEQHDLCDAIGVSQKAERVFLHLVRWHHNKGINVSVATGRNYAPLIFSRHPQAEGVSKRQFEKAQAVLLEQDKIKMVSIGSASRGARTIKLVDREQS